MEGKRGVDSSFISSINTSIYNELRKREFIDISDTNNYEKSSNFKLEGFVGKMKNDYFMLHLNLIHVSSEEIIRTVTLEFNGTIEELEGAVVKKAIDKIFKIDTLPKNKTSGKLSLSYVDNSRKKRNQIIRRVISGVATVGFSVAGVITNSKLQDLESEYDKTQNGSQAYYNRLWNDIEIYSKRRNAFISAASGSGIVFLVSIPF